MSFLDHIIEHPVIGAISTHSSLDYSSVACDVFFILSGDLLDLKVVVDAIKKQNKLVFVHVDLINGLKADKAGLTFIRENIDPSGIITTKGSLIKEAKAMHLTAIQRLFLLDSKNLETGLNSIRKYQPDAVEILPGALHKVTAEIASKVDIPVITGGLIKDKEDIIESIKAGAIGVSTSNLKLWSL